MIKQKDPPPRKTNAKTISITAPPKKHRSTDPLLGKNCSKLQVESFLQTR